jgi:DNA-binding PadR family transcriptional regulator
MVQTRKSTRRKAKKSKTRRKKGTSRSVKVMEITPAQRKKLQKTMREFEQYIDTLTRKYNQIVNTLTKW